MDNLCAQPMDPVRPVALLPAKEVYRSPKGEWIVDFGQIMCGRARIWVNAPRGTEFTFEYFEVTDHHPLRGVRYAGNRNCTPKRTQEASLDCDFHLGCKNSSAGI